ncbi:MAG: zeta toxin family protein [Streptosporangiaceae bacterium]
MASDAEPKDPPTRQEHAGDIPLPDEPAPSRSDSADQDSADQRHSADQANPSDQEEAPAPAEGDSSEAGDPSPHGDAWANIPEDSERQEELSDGAGIKPDAAKYGNRSTEDSPDYQPDHQLTHESDEASDPEVTPDDPNMSISATADGEASKADGGGPIDDQTRSLTDREWAEHITEVRDGLSKAYEQNLNTDCAYTINGAGEVWLEERDRLHDSIIEDLYARAADVPCDFKAIVAGGLGGAGKTTVLTQHAGIDLSQYLMINPDSMKEEMARRGMIPEVDGLSPMEASELAHEESSYLASQLALRAQADGKNLIWDITMSSEGSTLKRINELSSASYNRIDGLFVEIPVETSLKRIESRHREGHDQYRAGNGLGGRYVPPEVTKSQEDPEWGSKNMRTFDAVRHRFNGWSIYNNSVDEGRPVLVEESRNRHVG